MAQNSTKTIEQQFCRIASNMLVASDGVITAAVPIPDSISIAVHTKNLLAAVEQCGEDISLTQGDDHLLVKSGDFEAKVPALPLTDVPQVFADAPGHIPPPELMQALHIAGELCRANSPKLAYSTVVVDAGGATATNGSMILQAWHGDFALPRLVLPAAFLRLLAKAPAQPYRLGYTDESLTVWFEDGAWLKCQLYPANSNLPDYNSYLDNGLAAIPFNASVFAPLKTLKKVKASSVYFLNNHAIGNNGMSVECQPMPYEYEFQIEDLLALESWVQAVKWGTVDDKNNVVSHFFGAIGPVSIRAAIAHTRRAN